MKKAKILFYVLPLNEANYSVYYHNALIKLGYDVDSMLNEQTLREVMAKGNDVSFWKKYDHIIFMGFSFSNFLSHQGFDKFMPREAGVPYSVLYFDNPLRYGNSLKHLKDTDYRFFLCDSEETIEMKKFGYDKSYFAPTCFDPDIHKPGTADPKLTHNVVFPGTFLDENKIKDKIRGVRAGLNFEEQALIDYFISIREPGRYFDYHKFLLEHGYSPDTSDYGRLAFPLIMIQKHLLRVELFNAILDTGEEMHIFGKGDNISKNPRLIMHPNLNQIGELPDLYRSSKIITSIELHPSSCHQRIMDCVGNGGFILGEDKKDENYCFENIVQWNSLEDLKEKVAYYLNNEEERLNIAYLMRSEAMDRHTNVIRMQEILDVIGI